MSRARDGYAAHGLCRKRRRGTRRDLGNWNVANRKDAKFHGRVNLVRRLKNPNAEAVGRLAVPFP